MRLSLRGLGFLCSVAAISLFLYFIYPLIALDGISGVIAPLLMRTDTLYAPGFSHRKFLHISPGMTMAEVEKRLGPPLDSYEVMHRIGEIGWRYSLTPSDSSYRTRIIFFRDGKVSERLSEFYVD